MKLIPVNRVRWDITFYAAERMLERFPDLMSGWAHDAAVRFDLMPAVQETMEIAQAARYDRSLSTHPAYLRTQRNLRRPLALLYRNDRVILVSGISQRPGRDLTIITAITIESLQARIDQFERENTSLTANPHRPFLSSQHQEFA